MHTLHRQSSMAKFVEQLFVIKINACIVSCNAQLVIKVVVCASCSTYSVVIRKYNTYVNLSATV